MAEKKKRQPAKRRTTKKSKRKSSPGKAAFLCAGIAIGCAAVILINSLRVPGGKTGGAEQTEERESVAAGQEQNDVVAVTEQPKENAAVPNTAVPPESAPAGTEEKQAEKPKTAAAANAGGHDMTPPQKKASAVPEKNTDTGKAVPKSSVKKTAAAAPKKQSKTVPAPEKRTDTGVQFPAAVNGAKLVFVFDDAGQNLSQLEKYVTLPFPVTVAVLPQLTHSVACAKRVRASGNEVMLHQPMQALNAKINPGPGAITPAMQTSEIRALVKKNIEEIGPVAGVNNHEGSLISEDELKIGTVMQAAKESGAFFLDSRTTSQTRVPQASMELGISYYERNIFLDNTKNRSDIIKELRRGIDIANTKGAVIMIGHVWSADVLPSILIELYPALKEKGYTFTTVSRSGALKRP